MRYIRQLYDYVLRLAAHRHAKFWLFIVAFTESSFFPVPPDIMLIPMCLAVYRRAYFGLAFITLIGSVLGGIFGYFLGLYAFSTFAVPLMEFYGYGDGLEVMKQAYNEWGAWIVFGTAFTPIPYKIFTITSGAMEMNLVIFTVASFIGRGLRFFLIALLLYYFGAPIKNFIEKYMGPLTLITFLILFGLLVYLGVR